MAGDRFEYSNPKILPKAVYYPPKLSGNFICETVVLYSQMEIFDDIIMKYTSFYDIYTVLFIITL